MIVSEPKKRLAKQVCPLCDEAQDVMLNGFFKNSDGESELDRDRGYSFCNCRDIFFTDWSNMKPAVYDKDYYTKYRSDVVDNMLSNYVKNYLPTIQEHMETKDKFALELGSVSPALLDEFKKNGLTTAGMDIFYHPLSDHKLFVGDIEKQTLPAVDIIWASHIFEHFKNPIGMVEKCQKALNPGGMLFVAMPDPYATDWSCPNIFAHWNLDEHHILWDLTSFCNVLEENGFEIIVANRNYEADFVCTADYHILAKKR